jgi:VWFA-related protein
MLSEKGGAMEYRSPIAALAGVLALVLGTVVAGQTPSAEAPPSAESSATPEVFVDTVDVDVVDTPVVVTDRAGRPILGLTREDFEVYEDGRRMELTNFYAVAHGQRVPDAAGEEVEVAAPVPGFAPELPREQRLQLVVLVDSAHLAPGDRRRTLGELADRLGAMLRPDDRVMLATIEPDLKIVRPMAPELGPTVTALGQLSRRMPGSVGLELRRQQVLTLINGDGMTPTTGSGFSSPSSRLEAARSALNQIHSYAAEVDAYNRRAVLGLEGLVSSLAGLSGRKAVLYVSGGFSQRPAERLLEYWERVFSDVYRDPRLGYTSAAFEANQYDLRNAMSRLVDAAAANGVSFYAFDAGGFQSVASAERGAGAIDAEIVRDSADDEPLLYMAAATGGTAVLSANDPGDLLARIEDDYDDYYSLGYTSPNSRDGRRHQIEVRIPGHDFRVRYPQVYEAKSTMQEMTERTVSGLLLDTTDNPLEVAVEVGSGEREGRRWILPVLVTVPYDKLVLVPHGDSHRGRVSVVLVVRDEEGRVSPPRHVEIPVTVPSARLAEARGKLFGYGAKLEVRRGGGRLAVGVRDDVAAVAAVINVPLAAGSG